MNSGLLSVMDGLEYNIVESAACKIIERSAQKHGFRRNRRAVGAVIAAACFVLAVTTVIISMVNNRDNRAVQNDLPNDDVKTESSYCYSNSLGPIPRCVLVDLTEEQLKNGVFL